MNSNAIFLSNKDTSQTPSPANLTAGSIEPSSARNNGLNIFKIQQNKSKLSCETSFIEAKDR
jgi:hypothetical protein